MSWLRTCSALLTVFAVSGCGTQQVRQTSAAPPQDAAMGAVDERNPATASNEVLQVRIKKNVSLEPRRFSDTVYGVFISDGRLLSQKEVTALRRSNKLPLQQYCVLYTKDSRRFKVREGQSVTLKPVSPYSHWEPGTIYAAKGIPQVSSVGCFSLSASGRDEVTAVALKNQLNLICDAAVLSGGAQ